MASRLASLLKVPSTARHTDGDDDDGATRLYSCTRITMIESYMDDDGDRANHHHSLKNF